MSADDLLVSNMYESNSNDSVHYGQEIEVSCNEIRYCIKKYILFICLRNWNPDKIRMRHANEVNWIFFFRNP